MKQQAMKIAITGALGRVGSAVADLAATAGHTVVAIDRASSSDEHLDSTTLHVDLTEYSETKHVLDGCDGVIHLAAITGPGLFPDHVVHHNNVVASYNVLRAAAEVGIRRVCQASSVNAIGGRFSTRPRYDYFPVDELHPAYPEDPYSLSKSICEQQASSVARSHGLTIASLRLHGVVDERARAVRWNDLPGDVAAKHLWGYVTRDATARACLLGLTADFDGHEVFNIVAPDTANDTPSLELAAARYPDVPVKGDLGGNRSFYDTHKARELLGWDHDAS
jgi:UDP-glucose 4-epimerase